MEKESNEPIVLEVNPEADNNIKLLKRIADFIEGIDSDEVRNMVVKEHITTVQGGQYLVVSIGFFEPDTVKRKELN